MGWLFSNSWSSKASLLEHLKRADRYGPNKRLASRVVGMHHWYVVETPAGTRLIGLDLMQSGCKRSPAWGYKDLDETVSPSAVDCPLSLLNMATEPTSALSAQWRAQVLAHHSKVSEQRENRRQLASGALLAYGGSEYRLVRPAGPRKGWVVERIRDGQAFRMSDRQVHQAVPLAADAG